MRTLQNYIRFYKRKFLKLKFQNLISILIHFSDQLAEIEISELLFLFIVSFIEIDFILVMLLYNSYLIFGSYIF